MLYWNGLQLPRVSPNTLIRELIEMSLPRSSGPFRSEEDFNATIADTFVAKSKDQVGSYIRGMVNAHKHGIVFIHGDLRPAKIIVKNGRVARIIDW
jgi:tRNA A-37 threonylcarbamoyl transferase component Bud32